MRPNSIKYRHDAAFTFLEMVVTITVIGLIFSYALPLMVKARSDTRLDVIYSNLRQLEAAKDRWALEQNKLPGEPVPTVTVLEGQVLMGQIRPVAHESYIPNPIGTPPTAVLPETERVGTYGPGEIITLPNVTNEITDVR